MRWSWAGLLSGSFGGVFLGLIFGLAVWRSGGFHVALRIGLTAALTGALVVGTFFGGFVRRLAGLRDERTRPDEGVRHAAKFALLVGLGSALAAGMAAGLVFGLAGGPVFGLAGGPRVGLTAGLAAGLAVGTLFALSYGGATCLRHYVVRRSLMRAGAAPWRYGRFLEAMAERLLLSCSGSSYLFVHRLLRDYLADLPRSRTTGAGR